MAVSNLLNPEDEQMLINKYLSNGGDPDYVVVYENNPPGIEGTLVAAVMSSADYRRNYGK